jgi:hypothetical protein
VMNLDKLFNHGYLNGDKPNATANKYSERAALN